ncbi:DUF3099 domain-containing protein [Agromyces sp. CFH 90414]|uniref:DUF3099 domain-containing protein n=1 Tax=Agromyces agglutinans TaxID=2662258 RepID=A0A6I2F1U4_9MICO|nr:DUF3099 domain-containing protein [Agromyces agglutinans]MRG58452.1 DUF3099 domain-containing protein [Agromyces agglutinans]
MNQHTITTLPPSPEDERRSRMIKYTVAMSIRVVCIFLMLFAQGWWLAVCAAGAIFLPYVAVVLANVGGGRGQAVERPGAIVPVAPTPGIGDVRDETADAPGAGPHSPDAGAADGGADDGFGADPDAGEGTR